ncbi:MAG: type I DNA topoisomerase [Deferribacteraceae bacterium]|jgi:DNA topoisomerase-1|nr:type I DNA topoisomerase [Deferribacteraceae bacterium]
MAKKVVIVESPAKARTIEHYLGKDYTVLASVGHIVDLPSKGLNVDVDNGFKPTYAVINGKEGVVAKLKGAARSAEEVYLASDPDREGEAIAWHINEQIKGLSPHIYRVQFNEITESGVQQGIANPSGINMNRVDAQSARRILDRLVGYKVSQLLWKPLKFGLSAGRVQSVAVRLICEREEEIEKFVSQEWWSITANFDLFSGAQKKGSIQTVLDKYNKKKVELKSSADADKVIKALEGAEYTISQVEKKNVKSSPPPAFTTARLQQDAIKRLGFTAASAMKTAQELYEGVKLGAEGLTGLITYMRTDSVRISDEAAKEAAGYIKKVYGDRYIGGKAKPPKKSGKTPSIQDAHEAIRPTSILRTPEKVAKFLTPNQNKLYELIWKRFTASRMAEAVYEQTTVIIESRKYEFRASGRVMVFPGFTAVYKESEEEEEKLLINVDEKDTVQLANFDKAQHFTQPPPHFTEAGLVKALEQQGIGRPSTYAAIINTIIARKYVEKDKKQIIPTELGRIVNSLLVANFSRIFDLKFTATMEEGLDKVEEGSEKSIELLNEFYKSFSEELNAASKKFLTELKAGKECPKCGRELIIKYGRNGAFTGCSGYPECDFTADFTRNESGGIEIVERNDRTGLRCEKCGAELAIKIGKFGEMLACTAYPNCKNAKNFVRTSNGGIRVIEAGETLGKCPACEKGDMALKSGKRGMFAACTTYPDCKYTAGIIIDEEGNISLEKLPTPKELGKCEKCGSQMVIRRTFRGPFAACSAYPKCRNTKSLKSLNKNGEKIGAEKRVSKKKGAAKAAAKSLNVKKVVGRGAKKAVKKVKSAAR